MSPAKATGSTNTGASVAPRKRRGRPQVDRFHWVRKLAGNPGLTSFSSTGEREARRKNLRAYSMVCSSLPGLKRTAFPGGIETSAPVRGLRPMPVFRGRTLNTPNPRSSMRSPLASDCFMLSKSVSTASSALVLVIPVLFTTSLMMSSFITGGSQAEESLQSNQVLDAKEDKRDCQPPGFIRRPDLRLHQLGRSKNSIFGRVHRTSRYSPLELLAQC